MGGSCSPYHTINIRVRVLCGAHPTELRCSSSETGNQPPATPFRCWRLSGCTSRIERLTDISRLFDPCHVNLRGLTTKNERIGSETTHEK
jgi:hypothetical protein